MRRLIVLTIWLLLFLPLLAVAGWYYAGGAADDYSDLTYFWRCEGETLGADDYYGSGDNTATATSTVSINAAAVKIGTNGIDCPTPGDYYHLVVSSDDIVSGSESIIGFWWKITTWAESKVIYIGADTGLIEIRPVSSDELRVRINDGSDHDFVTTTSPLTTGTWYFVECVWKDSTNLVEIYISEDDGTRDQQLSTTGTAWVTPTNETILGIGNIDNVDSGDWHIDNVMISNDSTRNLYLIRNETISPK